MKTSSITRQSLNPSSSFELTSRRDRCPEGSGDSNRSNEHIL
jgi:hypothetical protein